MKVAFVLCLMALQGCINVTHPSPTLNDGRWGEYNELMHEQCAHAAMLQGIEHGLSDEATVALFKRCVFDQGIMI